jgi:thioredoxin 1
MPRAKRIGVIDCAYAVSHAIQQDAARREPKRRSVGGLTRVPGQLGIPTVEVTMGSAVNITTQNFRETVEQGGIVLLDFWAPWCGPCRSFGPVFEKVASANPDIVFGKVNTDEESELAGAFEIRSIPTLMVFRDRVLLYSQPGALQAPALEDIVRQVRAVDMQKVRAEIAAQGSKPGGGTAQA